ncbi:site-2 protease family protein [Chromobacterium sphagni]|uniref:Peptidase M50 n=1 Tax=Chromobacterium sphagni TaxID=1903179 RepID=A0A1S1X4T8_9NEIS|nr:site-2 protease family protein [Chromobacterium sphagni]OHX14499.1 peptidase M50 [Chromobacterium sphagni]OHX20579.1 peptidase M50 [Chromobacterium sphagni]
MQSLSLIQQLAISILPILFAITVPAGAQAYMADHLGDRTAFMTGRRTFSPLAHIDPVGSILLPLVGVALGGFIIGWPKSLQLNAGAMRKPRTALAKVALVTPLANLAMALLWAVLILASSHVPDYFGEPLALMALVGVKINVALMIFTLIPLPPLPGGVILQALLPQRAAWQFSKVEPYSFWILLLLMFSGILGKVLLPLVQLIFQLIVGVVAF